MTVWTGLGDVQHEGTDHTGIPGVPAGGSSPVVTHAVGDASGDHDCNSVYPAFEAIAGVPALAVPAVAGDVLLLTCTVTVINSGAGNADSFTYDIAGAALTDNAATRIQSGANEMGIMTITREYTVQAGDIVGGNVSVTAAWRTSGGVLTVKNTAIGGANVVPSITATNFGQ